MWNAIIALGALIGGIPAWGNASIGQAQILGEGSELSAASVLIQNLAFQPVALPGPTAGKAVGLIRDVSIEGYMLSRRENYRSVHIYYARNRNVLGMFDHSSGHDSSEVINNRGTISVIDYAKVPYNGLSRSSSLLQLDSNAFQKDMRALASLGAIGGAPVMNSRTPSEKGGGYCDGQGGGTHSALPFERRSLFVRVSGLIDSRLSCDTVTGNPYLALGVTWLLCGLGGWGVWRLLNGRWITGVALMAILLVVPMIFDIP